MNPTEAAQVLAKAAAYDNRQATQAAALAWAEALDTDMPLTDALRIVGEHYREERSWVMPSQPPPPEWQAMLDAATPRQGPSAGH